jgi:hypothetical protein
MRRFLAALCILVFTPGARSETFVVSPPKPVRDDLIMISLEIDDPVDDARNMHIPIPEGLAVVERDAKSDTEWVVDPANRGTMLEGRQVARSKLTIQILVRPAREGVFKLGPLEIPHKTKPPSVVRAVDVTVRPDADLSGLSYLDALKRLDQEGRARVHLHSSAKQSYFVGEKVILSWAIYTSEDLREAEVVTEPFIDEAVMSLPVREHFRELTQAPGIAIRSMRTLLFYPSRVGPLDVGEMTVWVRGDSRGERRQNESGDANRGLETTRTVPAFTISILPLPEGVSPSAVGRLEVECSSFSGVGTWESDVTIRGGGLIDPVTPRWEEPPDFEVRLELESAETQFLSWDIARTQKWKVRIPPEAEIRDAKLPALVVNWFDPETRTVNTERCWEPGTIRIMKDIGRR